MEDLAAKVNIVPPAGIAAVTTDVMEGKVLKGRFEMFLLALTGGAFIGLGFIFFTTSQMGASTVEWYGLTRVVGGLSFSVGLVLVVLTGGDLFTSTTMTVLPLVEKRVTVRQWLVHWLIVYVGNVIGSVTLALIVFGSGTHMNGGGAWGLVAVTTAHTKVSHTWVAAFFLGVLANLMVCLAIWTANAGRALVDKLLAITGPIALFVAASFEHSVANMFMIPMGILTKDLGGEAFWNSPAVVEAGLAIGDVSHLTWVSFFVDNLIPVTLGNILAGSVLVALYYWTIYVRPESRKKAATR